ncbi:hypothetical protein H072_4994 [Dactylellina haptotyla CBS 200.50]|uniref:Uncharacterized protein n=1 Tax=Dactylellina haptotyla (strain CBS 200.50) TaxID=1284197 RepID=S8ADS7_DACHA|nr:hypothetical protein H072_4994 [Dactylellina haptotyla CBS 200.50]
MRTSILRSALLPLTHLTLAVSAYRLNFYADTACSDVVVWRHSAVNDTSVSSLCEDIPTSLALDVQSASLNTDASDPYLGYKVEFYFDPNCQNELAKLEVGDSCVDLSSDTVSSFRVTAKLNDLELPADASQGMGSTYGVDEFGYGGYGDAWFNDPGADISPGSSGSGDAAGVMYPIDNSNPADPNFPANEAGTPGSADEEDCDTTKTEKYLEDNNNDGTADGVITEKTTTDPMGNIVAYDRTEVNYGQDIPGAVLNGPVVSQDPTANDPRLPDVGLDSTGSSSGAAYI